MNRSFLFLATLLAIISLMGCTQPSGGGKSGPKTPDGPMEPQGQPQKPIVYSFPGCKVEVLSDERTLASCPEGLSLIDGAGQILFNQAHEKEEIYASYEHIVDDTFLVRHGYKSYVTSPSQSHFIPESFGSYIGHQNGQIYFKTGKRLSTYNLQTGELISKKEGYPSDHSIVSSQGLVTLAYGSQWRLALHSLETGEAHYSRSYQDYNPGYESLEDKPLVLKDGTVVLKVFTDNSAGTPSEALRFFFTDGSTKNFQSPGYSNMKVFPLPDGELVAFTADGGLQKDLFYRFNSSGEISHKNFVEEGVADDVKFSGTVFYTSTPFRIIDSLGRQRASLEVEHNHYPIPPIATDDGQIFLVNAGTSHLFYVNKDGSLRFKTSFQLTDSIRRGEVQWDEGSQSLFISDIDQVYQVDSQGQETPHSFKDLVVRELVDASSGRLTLRTNKLNLLHYDLASQQVTWKYQAHEHPVSSSASHYRLLLRRGLAFVPRGGKTLPLYLGSADLVNFHIHPKGAIVIQQKSIEFYDENNELLETAKVRGGRHSYSSVLEERNFLYSDYDGLKVFTVQGQLLHKNPKVEVEGPVLPDGEKFWSIRDRQFLTTMNLQGEVLSSIDLKKRYYSYQFKGLPNGQIALAGAMNFLLLDSSGQELSSEVLRLSEIDEIKVSYHGSQWSIWVENSGNDRKSVSQYNSSGSYLNGYGVIKDYSLPSPEAASMEFPHLIFESPRLLSVKEGRASNTILDLYALGRRNPRDVFLFQNEKGEPWAGVMRPRHNEIQFYNSELEEQFQLKIKLGTQYYNNNQAFSQGLVLVDGRYIVDFNSKKISSVPNEGEAHYRASNQMLYLNRSINLMALDLKEIIEPWPQEWKRIE